MNELDHLWSGWRNAYVTTGGEAAGVRADDVAAGRGSVFTRILKSGLPDDETYVVHRSSHAFVILNAFPYGVGHSLVLPYREVATLEDLDAAEAVDLWSGWRNAYVTTGGEAAGVRADDVAAGRGSVFTRILKSGLPDDETYVVHRSSHAFVILNAFPYGVGHSLVLPYREVATLEDLDAAEAVDLWATVTAAVRATKHAYQPDGLNVGINLGKAAGGSVSQHLHVHVLPRWSGDVSFMTSVANARTMPETLDDTLAKLRAGFAATSGR